MLLTKIMKKSERKSRIPYEYPWSPTIGHTSDNIQLLQSIKLYHKKKGKEIDVEIIKGMTIGTD